MVKKTKSGNGFFKFLSLIRLKVNLEGQTQSFSSSSRWTFPWHYGHVTRTLPLESWRTVLPVNLTYAATQHYQSPATCQ